MPAFNVARTLERTLRALPEEFRTGVLLGDNQSTDGTATVARELGIRVLCHDRNYGYGGNLKRLFREALREGAEIVVELHPDGQYDPRLVGVLTGYIRQGFFDVMQGNRIRSRDEALAGGMPRYRYLGNRVLTFFENVWFGLSLGEWHSGMKAFRAEVLRAIPFENYPDSHAFASDILMDCVMQGFRVGEIPIPVRYDSESSSLDVGGLFRYSWSTFLSALKRPPWKKKRFGSRKLSPLPGGR